MSDFINGRPEPVRFDFSSDSDRMIIAFSSLRMDMKIPPFEWTGTLDSIPAKKIYVRDLYRLWYLKGLPGIANNPEEISDYLQRLIAQQQCNKVITLGGSMGGYAALLFGHLLEADEVHAFAGQTFLPSRRGSVLLKSIYKRGWGILGKQIELQLNRQVNRRYFNLRPFLNGGNGPTLYHLYLSTENKKDSMHARHVEDVQNVRIHKYHNIGHRVSSHMRDNGDLEKLLLRITN